MTALCLMSPERLAFQTTTNYRRLITQELFDRVVGRIVRDEGVEQVLAERIMDSALGFLWLNASRPGLALSPSPLVDVGWHTFILYTRGYEEFCQRVAGRFIHHEPNDNPKAEAHPGGIRRTIAAFEEGGLPLDHMLWTDRLTQKKMLGLMSNRALSFDDCSVDCDNGGGGPGGECSCS
jgi:hypothetical protein